MNSTAEQKTIKITVRRDDNLAGGFAAYLAPSLTNDGVAQVLLNVEATFHAAAANQEDPVHFVIENVMHEIGHALQEFFGREFSEEQVEGIVEQYRERYGIAAPEWYTESQMFNHLINLNYDKTVAEELAADYARNLQLAFSKGWEKASRQNQMDQLQEAIHLWQNKTFPNGTAEGQYQHLMDEMLELHGNIGDPAELADCAILLMGLASKTGVNLRDAVQKKMEINRARKWGEADDRGVIRHL